jgi:TIGR03009 family protein
VLRGAPFQLTKEQFQDLLAVLSAWEQQSSKIDLLRCQITVLATDDAFHKTTPKIYQGELKYQAPDKGFYRVEAQAKADGHAPQQIEHWVCDGKSVYQYDYGQKKVIRRDLPAELQGAGIGDGPMPFFFGAKANKLLHRYFMRVVTPTEQAAKQAWLEAYPRFQNDAANFRRATIILDKQAMMPVAVEVYSPGGNERSVHKFSDIQVGKKLWENFFGPDLFRVSPPSGWQMLVNPGSNQNGGPDAHTSRVPAPNGPIRKLLQGPRR